MTSSDEEVRCYKAKRLFSNITVEPVLFLFSLTQGLYIIIAQSLYVAKVCKVNLNYTEEICDNIFQYKEEQIEVQKLVSALQSYNGILQAIPAIIYALFAGPWSDTHGRRTLMIWACVGYLFNNGVFLLNTIFFYELKAEYLLFECLQDCTGGYVCFFLGCYSYISDITTPKNRTKRLAYLDGLFPIGFFTGMSISGPLKKKLGFSINFGLGMVGAFISMLYIIFFTKDSRNMRPPEVEKELEKKNEQMKAQGIDLDENKNCCLTLFDVKNVKSAFQTTFKKRPYGVRPFVILLALVFILEIFLINGKGPVMYLYYRKEYSWDESQFGQFVAVFGVVGLFTQYVAVPFFLETCGLHDTTLGFLGVVGSIIQQVVVAFTNQEWVLYVTGLIAFLSACITTTCRALVTKLVGPFEVGSVFAIMASFQAMVPLVASPVYGFLYRSTIDTFSGAILIFTACLYVVVGVLLIYINYGLRGVEKKKQADRDDKVEDEKRHFVAKGSSPDLELISE